MNVLPCPFLVRTFEHDTPYPTLLQHGVRHTTCHARYIIHSHYFSICCHRSETSLAVACGCSSELPDRQGDVPVLLQCIQVSPPARRGGSPSPHGYCSNTAWGHDDVTPISQGFSDDRNGWGATIIDSLDTMVRGWSLHSLCSHS